MSSNAIIIATGPSLTVVDCYKARQTGRKIYAVNDAYTIINPDILYACDEEWWELHDAPTHMMRAKCWTTSDAAALKYGLNHMPGTHEGLFDATGHGIVYGGNSGFQALNLAYAHGVRDVVLLGFDMGHRDDQPRHFFGNHPPAIDKPSPYPAWIKHWEQAAPEIKAAGMTVRNATRGGRLECFERVNLEDVT